MSAQTRTPDERRLQASAAGLAAHAKHGTAHMTAAAHKAANVTRFERLVDPDGKLPPAERAKRADHARRAHMQSLALKSAKARRLQAAESAGEATAP